MLVDALLGEVPPKDEGRILDLDRHLGRGDGGLETVEANVAVGADHVGDHLDTHGHRGGCAEELAELDSDWSSTSDQFKHSEAWRAYSAEDMFIGLDRFLKWGR